MAQTIERSFTGGEIAPALRSRADLVKYATGLALCENMFVRSQGGVYSRPGTKFITELDEPFFNGRLIPFQFNTEQTYMLIFEQYKMSVIKDGAMVLAGGGPAIYELTTPYPGGILDRLQFTQSADVMTITHPSWDTRDLSRTADDNWSLSVVDFTPTVTSPTWSGTPLATVGTGGGTYTKFYRYKVSAVDENGVESLTSGEAGISANSLSTTFGIQCTWNSVAGASYYRIYKNTSGASDFYGWIGDSETTSFEDYNIAELTSDAPLDDRLPFNGADNKPATVAYYQQRRIYANTNNNPQTIYTSQVGVYNSMRTSSPARASDAITLTINSKQVNEIRHLIELEALIVLTSGGEYRVTEGQDDVLEPASVGIRKQSGNGASWVQPAIINDTLVYVQAKGGRIRDINYVYIDNRYSGRDLSIMAEHLFEGYTITDMTYAAEPYSILWCVRDDGRLLGLTYQRDHEVWAWHQHATSTAAGESDILSVATVEEDGRDVLYCIVRRLFQGSVFKRYVERFEARDVSASENVWCVDSGLQYDGAPATVISGLDHLEDEAVAVVADGNVVEGLTVSSGSITLPVAASKVTVGLPFTPAIELLDIDVASTTDTLKGKSVSVSKVIAEVEDSRGMWAGPKNDDGTVDQFKEVKPREVTDEYDTLSLYTGKEEVVIDPQWSLGGGIRIEQRSPMPLAVLAVIPEVDVS